MVRLGKIMVMKSKIYYEMEMVEGIEIFLKGFREEKRRRKEGI